MIKRIIDVLYNFCIGSASSCMCQPKDEVKKTEKVETTASPYFGKTVPLDGGQGSESTSATKLITGKDQSSVLKNVH